LVLGETGKKNGVNSCTFGFGTNERFI